MSKISIIVPIYNVELYLKKCLDSIINQTFKNLEIILINDGSIDNSLKICNQYAKIDNRIRVIDKKNEGVSVARNLGIDQSTGDYIGFVDPDDWIEQNMYNEMYTNIVKYNSDICKCKYNIHDNNKIVESKLNNISKCLEGEEILENIIRNTILPEGIRSNKSGSFRNIWSNLYKRELLINNNITFNKELRVGQDLAFNIRAYYYANKISIVDMPLYNYLIRDGATKGYKKDCWRVYKTLVSDIKSFTKDNNLKDRFNEELDILLINYSITAILNEFKIKYSNKKYIKSILDDTELKLSLNRVQKNITKTTRRKIMLNLIRLNNVSLIDIYGTLYRLKRDIVNKLNK